MALSVSATLITLKDDIMTAALMKQASPLGRYSVQVTGTVERWRRGTAEVSVRNYAPEFQLSQRPHDL